MRPGCLGSALGLPIGAVLGLWGYHALHLDGRLAEARRPADTVMVIVAARDLPVGTLVGDTDVFAVQIPPSLLPAGVLLSPDRVVGARVTAETFANEFVRAERIEHYSKTSE